MTENVNPKMGNQPVFPMGGVKAGATGNDEERITSLEIGASCNGVREFESPMFGKIRVVGTSEKPLFCLTDVCNALGYKNSREALRKHVEEEDVTKRDTPTAGGLQSMTYVTESGLYSLIFGSKVEGARAFKRWVTSEVLPSIRKTGGYGIPRSYSEALLLAANQAKQIEMQQKALVQKQAENDKLVEDGKKKDATIVRMKPKEIFTDAVAGSKGNCLIGECAKLITQNGYKIGEKQFFAWLRGNGYLGKKGERYNIPNQQYVGKNALFYIKKGVRTGSGGVLKTTSTTMLTPKGQIYFVNKFLGKGGLQGDLFADGETHK